jgi:hypothetical protein
MHRLPQGSILQQGLPTSALENRRTQTRMQALIEKEEKKGGSSGQKQIKINTRCKTLHHSVWSNFVFEK